MKPCKAHTDEQITERYKRLGLSRPHRSFLE